MPLTDNCKCILAGRFYLPIRVSNLLQSKYKRLMEFRQEIKGVESRICECLQMDGKGAWKGALR